MIPIFGTKDLDDLIESDLASLKDKEIRESRFIEYKKEMYGRTDKEIEKLLAHITAFANAQVGYLFFGIDEVSNKNPIPKDIVGIDLPEDEAERIRNLCRYSIDEFV